MVKAGGVKMIDTAISAGFIDKDQRIGIVEGLAAGVPVKQIAAGIGNSFQAVYRGSPARPQTVPISRGVPIVRPGNAADDRRHPV